MSARRERAIVARRWLVARVALAACVAVGLLVVHRLQAAAEDRSVGDAVGHDSVPRQSADVGADHGSAAPGFMYDRVGDAAERHRDGRHSESGRRRLGVGQPRPHQLPDQLRRLPRPARQGRRRRHEVRLVPAGDRTARPIRRRATPTATSSASSATARARCRRTTASRRWTAGTS